MAIVTLDITHIEPSYTNVGDVLQAMDLPVCFGSMHLPLLKQRLQVDYEDCFAPLHTTPPDQVHEIPAASVLPNTPSLTDGFGLRRDAYASIVEYKRELIEKYSAQCKRCSVCDLYTRCHMLTQNSLQLIQLTEELEK